MGPSLRSLFRDVVGLESSNIHAGDHLGPKLSGSGRSVEVVGERGFTVYVR